MPLHPILIKTGLYKPFLPVATLFNKLYLYLDFLKWMDKQRSLKIFNDYYESKSRYTRRFELHDYIIENHASPSLPIDYFEFGVAQGEMISHWSNRNVNSASRFFGFDSFTGLPESWEDKAQGHFNTRGELPQINDSRVSFIKGWFQDTVSPFFKSLDIADRQAIYHLDADLFSSTLYVLFQIQPLIKSGDILIFDEFSSYKDEYLAFKIFEKTMGKHFDSKLIGAINNYRQVAIQITNEVQAQN